MAWYPVSDITGSSPLRVTPAPLPAMPDIEGVPASWQEFDDGDEDSAEPIRDGRREFPARGIPYLAPDGAPELIRATPCPGIAEASLGARSARVVLRYNVSVSVHGVLPSAFLAVLAQPVPLSSDGRIGRHGSARLVEWSLADGIPRAERGGGPATFDADAEYYVFRHARGEGASAVPADASSAPPPIPVWMVVETNNCTASPFAWRVRPRARAPRVRRSTTFLSRLLGRIVPTGGAEAEARRLNSVNGAGDSARQASTPTTDLLHLHLAASYSLPSRALSHFIDRTLVPPRPAPSSSPSLLARWRRLHASVSVLFGTTFEHVLSVSL